MENYSKQKEWPWLGAAIGTIPAVANELLHFLRLSEKISLDKLSDMPISKETDVAIRRAVEGIEKSAKSSPTLLICGSAIGAIGGIYFSRKEARNTSATCNIEKAQLQGRVSLPNDVNAEHGPLGKQ